MVDRAKIDGEILTVANGDLGDANTSYTYINMGNEDYVYFTLTYTIQATTLTLEASNDGQTIAAADATWTDFTEAITGSTTITVSGSSVIDTPIPTTRIRVKRLTTNATNALKLFLTRS